MDGLTPTAHERRMGRAHDVYTQSEQSGCDRHLVIFNSNATSVPQVKPIKAKQEAMFIRRFK